MLNFYTNMKDQYIKPLRGVFSNAYLNLLQRLYRPIKQITTTIPLPAIQVGDYPTLIDPGKEIEGGFWKNIGNGIKNIASNVWYGMTHFRDGTPAWGSYKKTTTNRNVAIYKSPYATLSGSNSNLITGLAVLTACCVIVYAAYRYRRNKTEERQMIQYDQQERFTLITINENTIQKQCREDA